jgi:hypothetical protein
MTDAKATIINTPPQNTGEPTKPDSRSISSTQATALSFPRQDPFFIFLASGQILYTTCHTVKSGSYAVKSPGHGYVSGHVRIYKVFFILLKIFLIGLEMKKTL